MNRDNRFFTVLGLLLFLLLCFVPNGNTQQGTPLSYANAPAQLSLSWSFTASSSATGGFNVTGLRYFQMFFIPTGTVNSCNVSFDSSTGSGFVTGGIITSSTIGSCANSGFYSNATPTNPTLIGQLTPSINGSGSVTILLLGWVNNPVTSPSTSSSIISPVDGSGNIKTNCVVGCGSSNPNGQATMANSAPVTIASNQSTLGVALTSALPSGSNNLGTIGQGGTWTVGQSGTWNVGQSGTWTVQPGNTANTTPWLMTVSTALPAGSNTIGNVNQNGTWTVQPGNTANTTPWLTTISTALPAGSNNIGTVGQNGSWNVGQSGTWTIQPGNTANTTPWLMTVSTALPAGSNTIGNVNQNGTWTVQPGNTANTTPWLMTVSTALPAGSNTIGNVNQNGTWTVQPGNTANTTPWLMNISAALPAGTNTIGNVTTQPAGFGSVVSFQQAVTASAVVLASNSVHGFCVKALPTNAITVYVGSSGVTTATGYPLAAGDSICYQGSNTNLVYVIATTTGSSVAVSAD